MHCADSCHPWLQEHGGWLIPEDKAPWASSGVLTPALQVTRVVGNELLDLLERSAASGLLGQGHSWVGPVQGIVPAAPMLQASFAGSTVQWTHA